MTLPDGRFGVVCYFYDLSERQRWEAALTESETRLADQKEAFELAVSGAPIHDVLNVLVRAGQRRFGPDARTAIFIVDPGRACLQCAAAAGLTEACTRAVDAFQISLDSPSWGSAAYTGEAVIVRDVAADPLWTPYLQLTQEHGIRACWSFPIRSATGQLIGTFAVYHSVPREPETRDRERVMLLAQTAALVIERHKALSEREQLLERQKVARGEAEAANRAKDRFLAVLSHELRTPLSPVVMTIPAIELDPDLPFKFREDLAMVRRNIDLEVKLIDDLLDLSRVTSGKLRLQLQPVRVHDLLRHVIQSSLSDISGKRLHIHPQFHATNDRLMADPARLQQVFWNLLRNAVKFTPEGGDITIHTWNSTENGHLLVEIADSGVGIPPDILPRVFDAFEQGDQQMTRQFGGLGLGLAIAKAVVEMHRGTISAASCGPGRGATFTVRLDTVPAVASDETPTSAGEAAVRREAGQSRVLLVEDHPDTARMLARLLGASGYDVTTAHSMASALQLAAAEPFDVVVSDIGLPDATGYELMEQIRDRHGIKGIALSGYGMEEDMRKSREAGFADHVVKPVNVTQLDAVIRRVTSGH